MSESIIGQLEEMGVFPIVVIEDPDDAEPLGEALLDAGLPCVEVTFRTASAGKAIARLASRYPQLLLGAGTVLKIDQAKEAEDLGVRFVLAPGFNPKVVDYCLSRGLTVFPGVCTPTEIEAALDRGLTVLKFFPAEAMGGLPYLKAISAPLSMVRYLPTGGINLQNLPAYLEFRQTLACAGTWIAKKEWLRQKRFDLIGKEAAQALEVVRTVRTGGLRA